MKTNIDKALEVLRAGGLILYPTDTVWGIGCDATCEDAVRRVFALKRRSDSKSLVLLAKDMDMVADYLEEVPEVAAQLVEVNDAPMTIVYPGAMISSEPARKGYFLAPSCVAEDGSVGMRIPSSSEFCMKLLAAFRKPLVSTSANISGEATPVTFAAISPEIVSGVDFCVDPSCLGRCTGKSSQIIKVDLDGAIKIIRG